MTTLVWEVPSIKILHSIPYRGQTKQWTNRWGLNNALPPDDAAWIALFTAIRNAEKSCYGSGLAITGAVGYDAGTDIPVWFTTVNIPGTLASLTSCPGDSAVMVRWKTDQLTKKNHPIYLYKYFHGATWSGSGSSDTLASNQKTAFETYAAAWQTGFSDGHNVHNYCGPRGGTGHTPIVDAFVRHRDFVN